ncbi:MAG: ATP-binding cassette domain-containing protein [Methanobacteriaceae archaeon]|nr:ATP-binding cassette domain-containing protein [Methanobacteriaceae archaeon]
MVEYVIESHDLTKRFGKEIAVNSLNLHVERGKIYGLLGKNGAGKTTTMCMLLNLARPSTGEIRILGEDPKKNPKVYSKIGSIIETPGFYENLSAFDNLRVFSKLRGDYNEKSVLRALEIVDLLDDKNKKFKKFSLGMKQRLGIAAAIVHNPEILILDEPINGLDPVGIIEIRNLFKKLVHIYGITIIISSHILSEIEVIADVIGFMKDGVLVEELSKEELQSKMNKYVEFEVSDVDLASKLLEDAGLKKGSDFIIDYGEKYDSTNINSIKLLSYLDMKSEFNRVFVNAGLDVEKVNLTEESLEEYFTELME